MEDKNYGDIKDKEYYSALQNSLQSYDAKLWLIPGLFFVVFGFIANGLDKNNFLSFYNGIISLSVSVFLFLLIIYYNKAHLFFLLIQQKINEFDGYYNKKEKIERIPLASMEEKKLRIRLRKLINDGELEITDMQYSLANSRVSFWTRNLMVCAFSVSLIFGLLCIFISLYYLILK